MTARDRERLVGPVVSLPTFCDDSHNLLLDRQRKHVRWLIDSGIKEGDGVLLIAGGVGETYMLEDDEFYALADLLPDETGSQTPTMVMVSEVSAKRAARKARYASDAGIDYMLLSPPHYSLPTEDDIFLHHQYVNDASDIGIVVYNSYWVMPGPGYAYSSRLFERFAGLEHIIGVKWSAADMATYVGMQKRFGDRFNFIENMFYFSQGSRYGMKGFIDLTGNAAPKFSLHMWDMLKSGRHDEFDEFYRKHHFEPSLLPGTPEETGFSSVGDAHHALMTLRLLGLDAGPAYPGQAAPPEAHVEYSRRMIEASGIKEWVTWDQSILDERAGQRRI